MLSQHLVFCSIMQEQTLNSLCLEKRVAEMEISEIKLLELKTKF
jgi:hypothetical protein